MVGSRKRAISSWWDGFPAKRGLCPDLPSLGLNFVHLSQAISSGAASLVLLPASSSFLPVPVSSCPFPRALLIEATQT